MTNNNGDESSDGAKSDVPIPSPSSRFTRSSVEAFLGSVDAASSPNQRQSNHNLASLIRQQAPTASRTDATLLSIVDEAIGIVELMDVPASSENERRKPSTDENEYSKQ